MKLPNLDTLSLPEQVAQMVVVRASGYLFDHQIQYPEWEPPAAKLRYWLEDLNVGGVILLGGSAIEIALRSQQLQDWAKTPLLVAADIEEGVGQRFAGATWLPPPMAISTVARQDFSRGQHYAQQMGAVVAQEALAIGINWLLAPVVDVNNNPDNPVINVRAFGENTAEVSQLATAFIEGAKAYPVLTTAKHFPGHGDTAIDSHLDLPVLLHSSARLTEVELPPFAAVIAAGVDAVMSAHLLIQCWDAARPATLSERVLTQQLRQHLGFEGLIVTDALVMGAIANCYGPSEAPVLAVEAGADILLMPMDPEGAIQPVSESVATGRIAPERIRTSVERIWQARRKVSMEDPPSRPYENLAQSNALKLAADILQESQVVRGSPLQLEPAGGCFVNLIVVDDPLACDFLTRHDPAISLRTQLGYTTRISYGAERSLATGSTFEQFDTSTATTFKTRPTLLQLFIRGNPFRGSSGLTQVAQDWLQSLLQSGDLQALVIYGSPYVLSQFLSVLPPEMPCVFSYGQMPTAQAIALKTLFGV